MEKYCILCGEVLPEGVTTSAQHHQFKKMCLNCAFSKCENEDTYFCTNETNRKSVEQKILDAAQAVSEAYKVTNLKIEPLPLKKVTGKCKQWELHGNILSELPKLFI